MNYINQYKDLAISEMNRSGIPASITLAQGMVESDYGRSTLAVEANNHFGIKCHNDWNGPTIRHDDDARNECFRKYRHVEESYRDHTDFLVNGSRYAGLFELNRTDYVGWARGLKQAGYATNPDYANMLIRKIEELGLHQYDLVATNRTGSRSSATEVASNNTTTVVSNNNIPIASNNTAIAASNNNTNIVAIPQRVQTKNRIEYIVVKNGESAATIEQEFDMLGWELARYNELENGFDTYEGQILYLQPKRDRAEVGSETHVVKEGETIYSVSQLYGVKSQKLREYNMLREGEEPATGSTLWLRGLRPVR
jgi:LysM repeat protein